MKMNSTIQVSIWTEANFYRQKGLVLNLPAQPWELVDAADQVRLEDGASLKGWILDFKDFSDLRFCILPGLHDLLELNDLAYRLAELDENQQTALQGLVQMQPKSLIPFKRLRDLAASVDCCRVMPSVINDEQLGQSYVENMGLPELGIPWDRSLAQLDFKGIGHRIRKQALSSTFVPSGVADLGGYVAQVRELVHAPTVAHRIVTPDYIFRLSNTADNSRLDLPAPPGLLEQYLRDRQMNARFRLIDSAIPKHFAHPVETDELETLNRLAHAVEKAKQAGQLIKLKALLAAKECADAEEVLQCTEDLDLYQMRTDIESPAKVARETLHRLPNREITDLLLPHVDLVQFGFSLIHKNGSAFTDYGLLERRDGQPVQEITEQPLMGGMEMM